MRDAKSDDQPSVARADEAVARRRETWNRPTVQTIAASSAQLANHSEGDGHGGLS